jgi:type IV pilus assembly protein PilQ
MWLNTKIIVLLVFLIVCPCCFATTIPNLVTLDMKNIAVADALRILAKHFNFNVVISPAVTGNVSLHLQGAYAIDAFNLVLSMQALTKVQQGNVWLILTNADFIKQKQDEWKMHDALAAAQPLVSEIWQVRYAKAEDIAHLLQDNNASLLSKQGHVRVDTRTNIICIQDTAESLVAIHALMQKLDVPVQQILIKARLVSIDSDYERDLGLNFLMQQSASSQENTASGSYNAGQFSLAVARLADNSLLDITLAALEKTGRGELISSPSLFAANQQSATIEAGEEIPYQEISRSGASTVAFKKAVLSLKVTPQIMPGKKVLLQLQVNQDKPSNRIVLGVPAITTRQITTHILIADGQTLVLGGIYERNKEQDKQGIPFLSKIPLVGWVFQKQNEIESKRELLIFVTPQIIAQ